MESAHKLNDKNDIEAYIARLSQFDAKFEQVLEGLKIREEKGIVPPKFVIDRVLNEMKGFVGKQMTEEKAPVEADILYSRS